MAAVQVKTSFPIASGPGLEGSGFGGSAPVGPMKCASLLGASRATKAGLHHDVPRVFGVVPAHEIRTGCPRRRGVLGEKANVESVPTAPRP